MSLVEMLDRAVALFQRYERTSALSTLERAVDLLRRTAKSGAEDDPDWPWILSDLGNALQMRFERTGRAADLDEAITWFERAVDRSPTDPRLLSNLGNALRLRYQSEQRAEDLDRAVTVGRRAVTPAPADHAGQAMVMSNLGLALILRYESLGRVADLDEAVDLARASLAAVPVDDDRHSYLSNLGAILQRRFDHRGRPEDLDEAVAVIAEAVDATPDRHPRLHLYLGNLADAYLARHRSSGDPADLDEAVDCLDETADTVAPDHPAHPTILAALSEALRTRFERAGDPEDLDEAVAVGKDAAHAADDANRAAILFDLASTLAARYELTGQRADLEEAIEAMRRSVGDTSVDHPDRPRFLSVLSDVLLTRYRAEGHAADLTEAAAVAREAVALAPMPVCLLGLAHALHARFELTGRAADLEDAVGHVREAVAATAADDAARPVVVGTLAHVLSARYETAGLSSDLDEALEAGRDAIARFPATHPNRTQHLSGLADTLRMQYERHGRPADLTEAVAVAREAVAAAPVAHRDRSSFLLNLANPLLARYQHTGQSTDLDEAIDLFEQSVGLAHAGDVDRRVLLSGLSSARQERFNLTRRPSDLDGAVSAIRDAVALSPSDDPYRSWRLNNLGTTLLTRHDLTEDPRDLDEALSRHREAIDLTTAKDPHRPDYLSNLGLALQRRFTAAGLAADLDAAVDAFAEAAAAARADYPTRSLHLVNLGDALDERYRRTGCGPDLAAAAAAFREGARVLAASPRRRLVSAWKWGRVAMTAGDARTAVQAYTEAIELLPAVVWHGLDRSTREEQLRDAPGLATEAASAAVAAGQPETALELLESSRSVLWAQALQLRHDLTVLREQAPDLAEALERARAVLAGDPDPVAPIDSRASDQRVRERRQAAARDWDTALTEVRMLVGFEHFLRPVASLTVPTPVTGTVAVVIISGFGSHALLIGTASGTTAGARVRVVELPEATLDAVGERATTLLAVVERAADSRTSATTIERDRNSMIEILAWTWRAITEPVLDTAGHTGIPDGRVETWPRVWWCPTGPAMVLPLHAAGVYPLAPARRSADGDPAAFTDTVPGRVVSSYTPTLSALARASRSAPPRVRQLAVCVPDTPVYEPAASPLPAATRELRAVAEHLPEPELGTHLIGTAATRANVLHALVRHPWLHLSCHAVQSQTDPNLSAFLLQDRPMTLGDLVAMQLPDADLAYLAACHTASGSVELIDESLHLAAGLQVAGFRHVVATLWSISDRAAPTMAGSFYRRLVRSDDPIGQPIADRSSHALHLAVEALRRAAPANPLVWAPYIHMGP